MSSREESIKKKIMEAFNPVQFKLENESHMHSGPRTESHFKIFLVSDSFEGLSRVDRQRLVNDCLKSEFDEGMHALTMRLKTSAEDQKIDKKNGPANPKNSFTSPDCSSKK